METVSLSDFLLYTPFLDSYIYIPIVFTRVSWEKKLHLVSFLSESYTKEYFNKYLKYMRFANM